MGDFGRNESWLLLTAAGGVISALLGLGMRRIAPNRWYGIRTPSTYADRRVWRDANERSGNALIVFGAGIVLFSLILWVLPGKPWQLAMIALFGGTLTWSIASVLYANRRGEYYYRLDRGLAADELRRE